MDRVYRLLMQTESRVHGWEKIQCCLSFLSYAKHRVVQDFFNEILKVPRQNWKSTKSNHGLKFNVSWCQGPCNGGLLVSTIVGCLEVAEQTACLSNVMQQLLRASAVTFFYFDWWGKRSYFDVLSFLWRFKWFRWRGTISQDDARATRLDLKFAPYCIRTAQIVSFNVLQNSVRQLKFNVRTVSTVSIFLNRPHRS